jgi:hypothetical protein
VRKRVRKRKFPNQKKDNLGRGKEKNKGQLEFATLVSPGTGRRDEKGAPMSAPSIHIGALVGAAGSLWPILTQQRTSTSVEKTQNQTRSESPLSGPVLPQTITSMCTYNVGAIGPFYLYIIRHFDPKKLSIYLLSPVGTTIKDNHSRLHESLITNVSFTVTLWDLSSNGEKINLLKSSVQSKTNLQEKKRKKLTKQQLT